MIYTLLLWLLLFPTTIILPMEKIPNDILTYTLCPYLPRPTKDSLICTNKYFFQHIISQKNLNLLYDAAYKTNNINAMADLREKGALPIHEEIYNFFINNEDKLAKKIWEKHIFGSVHICIKSTFFHGAILNNKDFIVWILEKANPPYNGYLIETTMILAKNLNHNDITKTLTDYVTKNKPIQQTGYPTRYYSFSPEQRILYNTTQIPL